VKFTSGETSGPSPKGKSGSVGLGAIDELRNAFDLVDRTAPGVVDALITEIIQSFAGQTMSESEVDAAVQIAMRYHTVSHKNICLY